MERRPSSPQRRFDRRPDAATKDTLAALTEAVRVRDGATGEHCDTVARLARATAVALGLGHDRAEEVELAGRLHDLGKVGIPDSVLHKPGPLTESEWRVVQAHPEIGARIVRTAGLEEISSWIMLHHERPDRCGYPYGLGAAAIPLEAAIVAVADAYEAMTADRPYRPALGEHAARAEIEQAAGAQFDPAVVEAFLGLGALSRSRRPA
jgi:HD-GYP domain-containing protein (c-di-GMP phosphodiesterase class II)